MTTRWTAAEVLETLCERLLAQPGIANFVEFTFQDPVAGTERRADLFAIATTGLGADEDRRWGLNREHGQTYVPAGWRFGFEIKVAVDDLRGDLRHPSKREAVRACAHEFYYVTPRGLTQPAERFDSAFARWNGALPENDARSGGPRTRVPHGVGLIEVWRDQRKRWLGARRAEVVFPARPNLQPHTPPSLVPAIAKRTLWGRVYGCARCRGHESSEAAE